MKFKTLSVFASVIVCCVSIGLAQEKDEQGPGGKHHPPPPLIAALDLNHDGVISADEIKKAPESLLTLDKNGDGQLTREELHPPRPNRGGGDENAGPGNKQPGQQRPPRR